VGIRIVDIDLWPWRQRIICAVLFCNRVGCVSLLTCQENPDFRVWVLCQRDGFITGTNRMQFVLFGMQNRAFGPYSMTYNSMLIFAMVFVPLNHVVQCMNRLLCYCLTNPDYGRTAMDTSNTWVPQVTGNVIVVCLLCFPSNILFMSCLHFLLNTWARMPLCRHALARFALPVCSKFIAIFWLICTKEQDEGRMRVGYIWSYIWHAE
jgi:hypothetical protein